MSPTWQSFPWSTLIAKIERGYCTPFIGAGASYPSVPLAKGLAAALLKLYGEPCPLSNKSDLAAVCQFLSIKWDSQTLKFRIADLIVACETPNFNDPTEPHRMLADLRLPLYITTNYDDFMVSALRRKAAGGTIHSFTQEFCRWTDIFLQSNDSAFDKGTFQPTSASPVVFHLHGHIDRSSEKGAKPSVEAMVATEDDYLDFLINISQTLNDAGPGRVNKRQMLPREIQKALRSTTLLFVGYSLGDVNFRVILRALRRSLQNSNEPLHIAIQYADDNPRELQEYLEEYFKRMLTLNVFWSTPREFSSELRKQWQG